MVVWGAVCVNCALTVLRGAGINWWKVEMMWHRRETRRQTEKTKLNLRTGSGLPTHPILDHPHYSQRCGVKSTLWGQACDLRLGNLLWK